MMYEKKDTNMNENTPPDRIITVEANKVYRVLQLLLPFEQRSTSEGDVKVVEASKKIYEILGVYQGLDFENYGFVPKFYRMDPKEEDILFDGTELRNGMVVLVDSSNQRQNITSTTPDFPEFFDIALRMNRWMEVSDVRVKGEVVEFVGKYDDDTKNKHRWSISMSWLVKKSSIPEEVIPETSDEILDRTAQIRNFGTEENPDMVTCWDEADVAAAERAKGVAYVEKKLLSRQPLWFIKNKANTALLGRISNRITDLMIQKAPAEEIAPLIAESMMVINSEKLVTNIDPSAYTSYESLKSLAAMFDGATKLKTVQHDGDLKPIAEGDERLLISAMYGVELSDDQKDLEKIKDRIMDLTIRGASREERQAAISESLEILNRIKAAKTALFPSPKIELINQYSKSDVQYSSEMISKELAVEVTNTGENWEIIEELRKAWGAETPTRSLAVISNELTDMTIRGAKPEDIMKVIAESMVAMDRNRDGKDVDEYQAGWDEIRERQEAEVENHDLKVNLWIEQNKAADLTPTQIDENVFKQIRRKYFELVTVDADHDTFVKKYPKDPRETWSDWFDSFADVTEL